MSSKKNKVLKTEPVLGETEPVLGETEAVLGETEAVLGETEPVVEKTLWALVYWVMKNMPKDEVVKNVVEYIEKTSISDHCKIQHIKTIKDIFSKID